MNRRKTAVQSAHPIDLAVAALYAGRPFSDRVFQIGYNLDHIADVESANHFSALAIQIWPHYCQRFLSVVEPAAPRAGEGHFLVFIEEATTVAPEAA